MSNESPVCHECGSLLYFPWPLEAPIDLEDATLLTAEQMGTVGLICPLETCSSHRNRQDFLVVGEPNGEIPRQQQEEQQHDQQFINPQLLLRDGEASQPGGDEPQILNNEAPQPPVLNNVPQGPVERETPCRKCYQNGTHCRDDQVTDNTCRICRSAGRKCQKSLFQAKPAGFWKNRVVHEDSSPVTVEASRIKNGELEYLVKNVHQNYRTWLAAGSCTEFPWALKKFHLEFPNMAGPPDWLFESEEDNFFEDYFFPKA
ncbi:hypothetical protein diail_8673 [Diaporthe ilicicola]|nr:hypothetical protein diail_8673 [Diaporthe ilicicola]